MVRHFISILMVAATMMAASALPAAAPEEGVYTCQALGCTSEPYYYDEEDWLFYYWYPEDWLFY